MKKNLLILFTMALTLALAMPAMAILHFEHAKGQRFDTDAFIVLPTYWQDVDYSDAQETAGSQDDADFIMTQWGDSRVTGTLTSGPLSGTWQLGLGPDFTNISTRLLYASWQIDDNMTLALGKMYAPYYVWGSGRLGGDLGEGGYGSNWDDFDPSILFKAYGAFVYVKNPLTPGSRGTVAPDTYGLTSEEYDTTLPRIYVGYNNQIVENFSINTALGYSTFNLESDPDAFDEDIEGWVFSFYAMGNINDMVSLKGGGQVGKNLEEMGYWFWDNNLYTSNKAGAVIDSANNNQVEDTAAWAGFAELTLTFGNKNVTFGYGYGVLDNDTWSEDDPHQTYFAQATIPIYEHESGANIIIMPEVAVFDQMEDNTGADEEQTLMFGAIWQAHF